MTVIFLQEKLTKKIRMKVLTKMNENEKYISFDQGYFEALGIFRFSHHLSLDPISKNLSNKECEND